MKKLALVCFFLTLGVSLFAQDLTLPQLNQKVKELENRITLLEQALASQVREPSDRKDLRVPASKKAWRQLKSGMSQEEVKKLLGEPDQVIVSGTMTFWTISSGTIMFHNSRLDSWTEP